MILSAIWPILMQRPCNLKKVTCMRTRPFKINHVHDETKTVLLLDSNGIAFEDLDIPSNMQVFAFSGSKISDIMHILTSSESALSRIDTMVTGIGTNNRNDLNASQAIQDMKDILHSKEEETLLVRHPSIWRYPSGCNVKYYSIEQHGTGCIPNQFLTYTEHLGH